MSWRKDGEEERRGGEEGKVRKRKNNHGGRKRNQTQIRGQQLATETLHTRSPAAPERSGSSEFFQEQKAKQNKIQTLITVHIVPDFVS